MKYRLENVEREDLKGLGSWTERRLRDCWNWRKRRKELEDGSGFSEHMMHETL